MTVQATRWLGICDYCGEPAPDERDSQDEAEQDIADCPCQLEVNDEEEE